MVRKMFSSMQVIKILRDNSNLSLKEAKDVVDSYVLRDFEDRAVRALSAYGAGGNPDEFRDEMQRWAYTYVAKNRDAQCTVQNPCVACRDEMRYEEMDYEDS